MATMFVLIAAVALPAAADFQVGVNGNTIWVRIGAGLTGKQCCRGASLDEPQAGASCSVACPANPEDYLEFPCNSVGTHVVYGCVLGAETNYEYVCESKTIEVTQPAPISCPLFDFYTVGNRVLTHKYGVGDGYPPGQDADSEITLKLREVLIRSEHETIDRHASRSSSPCSSGLRGIAHGDGASRSGYILAWCPGPAHSHG